jgi:hypothetical protein
VIELLGVSVPRAGGGWLLHRVCARLEEPALTAVVSSDPRERLALLDTVSGDRLPQAGRAYVSGIPVTGHDGRRLERLVGEVELNAPLVSSLALLARLRDVARADRVNVLVSVAALPLASEIADRVLVIAGGGVVFDGRPRGHRGSLIA